MRRLIARLPFPGPRKAGKRAAGRRRGASQSLAQRLRRHAAVLLLMAAVSAGAGFVWWSGGPDGVSRQVAAGVRGLSIELGLSVRDIYLAGRQRTPRRAILAALGVSAGQSILDFDPHAAKARLEAIAWIREATVERRLPGTIRVRLVERQPFALWQHDGKFALVDRDGVVLETKGVGRFSGLPLLVGADAARRGARLLRTLSAEPELARRVTAAVRVGGRRWDLRLGGGLVVKLPERDAGAAWARLARLERQFQILARDLTVVDLRLADRLTVGLPDGLVQTLRPRDERQEEGHET